MNTEIQEILRNSIDPLKVSLFFNANEYEDYKCFYSSSKDYEVNKEYTLYDLKGLLRVTCLKRDILCEELLKKVYSKNLEEVCLILEWNDHARKIMIIQTSDLDQFNEDLFIKSFHEETESLLNAYQKLYFNFQANN